MIQAAVLLCLAAPAPQLRGSDMLRDIVSTLHEARTLRAEYMFGYVDGAPLIYTITAAKPDKVRIESDYELYIANGVNVVKVDKITKTFSRRPQTVDTLEMLMTSSFATVWGAFFFSDVFGSVVDPIYAGSYKRGDDTFEAISFRFLEDYSAKLYMDMDAKVPRQAEFTTTINGTDIAHVLNAYSVELNEAVDHKIFNWEKPSTYREVAPEEEVWFTDLDKAKASAWNTRRLIMMFFTAGWSVQGDSMESTVFVLRKFKNTSKDFVFMHVDVDESPELADAFKVKAVPTLVFMKPNGQVVLTKSGGLTIHQLLTEVDKVKKITRRK